jgi:hypothetical protein
VNYPQDETTPQSALRQRWEQNHGLYEMDENMPLDLADMTRADWLSYYLDIYNPNFWHAP